ncbi:MAG: GlsB/YeaQ/YmgE family stress response membrane protein [Rhodomicrobium sp.]
MQISLYQAIVWLIIGLAGGTLAGLIVRRDKRGFGFLANLGLGLAGAIIGGLLFRLLDLFPNLDKISISARDIVSALAGSMLLLGLLWLWRRWNGQAS